MWKKGLTPSGFSFRFWVIISSLFFGGAGLVTAIGVDSLASELEVMGEDTNRARLLIDLSKSSFGTDLEESLSYGQEALDLSNRLGYEAGIAEASKLVGYAYGKLGLEEEGMTYLVEGAERFRKIGNKKEFAKTTLAMGWILFQNRSYDQAIARFEEAWELSKEIEWERGYLTALTNIASAATEAAESNPVQVRLAVQKNEDLLAAVEGTEEDDLRLAAYNNLSLLTKNQDSSLYYLKLAEVLVPDVNKDQHSVFVFTNLADIYLKKGKLEKAREYSKKGMEISQSLNDVENILRNIKIQAGLAHASGNHDSSIAFMNRHAYLQDSLFSAEQEEKAANLEIGYNAKRNREEIEWLKEEKAIKEQSLRRQSWLLAVLAIFLVGLAFSLVKVVQANRKVKLVNTLLTDQNHEIREQGKEINKQNQELKELHHEKDGVLAIVAHDLKSPLNKMKGLAHLVALAGPVTEEQEEFLDLISEVSIAGENLIRDLIDISKPPDAQQEKERISRIDLNYFVPRYLRSIEAAAAQKSIVLEFVPSETDFFVAAERQKLSRIMENLVPNAIKFSPPGKKVWVKVRPEKDFGLVSIKDEGPGLTPEDKEKMFKKFQKLSAKPTGGENSTGLGLSIVKTFTERMNGKVEVQSEQGKGAEFIVFLPLVS